MAGRYTTETEAQLLHKTTESLREGNRQPAKYLGYEAVFMALRELAYHDWDKFTPEQQLHFGEVIGAMAVNAERQGIEVFDPASL